MMIFGRMDLETSLDRWVREGLLDEETASRLREDARRRAARRRRRMIRGLVAGTAAVVLIFAAILFLRDVWEALGAAVQSGIIAAAGVTLFAAGLWYERRLGVGKAGVAYGLQAAGLGVLAAAYGYSGTAWPSGMIGGKAVAALSFLTPAGALALVGRRNRVMPAVVLVGAYVFFAVGLERFAADPSDAGVWILDGIFVVLTVGIANTIRIRLSRAEGPATVPDDLLVAFAAHLYVGFPLLSATGAMPLDLGADTFFLVDGWLVAVTALVAWTVHAAPPALRRSWMRGLLPVSVALATFLAFPTVLAGMEGDATGAAGLVAVVGLASLAYGIRAPIPGVVELACLALVVAAWTYTAAEESPLAGAAALAGTAALLFWLARRLGREEEVGGSSGGGEAPDVGGSGTGSVPDDTP